MKTIIKLLLMTFSAATFFGCQETTELDLDQAPARVIVDGLITNEYTQHYVKLTQSVGFYHAGEAPGVSSAQVEVYDNEGNTYEFTESETTAGLYTAQFEGSVGQTYHLNVNLPNGNSLYAEETMEPVMQADSLAWRIDEEEQKDPEKDGFFYQVLVYGEEPVATKDYYLFKSYRNDTLQNNDTGTGIYLADDLVISGYIEGFESPEYYKVGDEARFEIHRLSRDAFLFYNDLNNILNGDGGMLSPPPTNPRSNILSSEGQELGLFQVSAINKNNIVVGE